MFLTDRLGSSVRFDADSLLSRATASSRGRMPAIIAIATIIGLASVVALTPVTGRGDYGQWLMTSRFYLGESVPSYRDIPALPALVPVLLAGMQVLLRSPEAVLPGQFDEYIWLDETSAVKPFETTELSGLPDTYPFGV